MPTNVLLTPDSTGFVRPDQEVVLTLSTSDGFPEFLGWQGSVIFDTGELTLDEIDLGDPGLIFVGPTAVDVDGISTTEPVIFSVGNGALLSGANDVGTFTFTAGAATAAGAPATVTIAPFNGTLFLNQDRQIVFGDAVSAELGINTRPVGADDTGAGNEDTDIVIDVLGNDVDADAIDALTIESFSNGDMGLVALQAGKLTYTPDANFAGTDTFTYVVTDGKETSTATVTVTVANVNDAPIVSAVTATTSEDQPTLIDVLAAASDPDMGDVLRISDVADAMNGTAMIEGDAVRFTPADDYNGVGSFAFFVTDGTETIRQTATVTVTPVNDDPTAVGDERTLDEGGSVEIDVLANDSDVDGDTLTLGTIGDASNGAITKSGNSLIYTPVAGFNGDDSFVYEVIDGKGGSATATVSLTINPINDAPTAGDDFATVLEDKSVTISVLNGDTDPDGDELSVTGVGGAANGMVVLDGNEVTYTPNRDYVGSDSFTYDISDGKGGTDTGTVTVDVTPVNDAPILTAGASFEVVEGDTGAIFTPSVSDPDDDSFVFSLGGPGASRFDIDEATGAVRLSSAPVTADGAFSVDVIVSDGEATDSRSVAITVLNDADGDGVADRDDNAVFVFNANQRDSNGDGIGNVIDADLNGDLVVDLFDLAIFRAAFGQTGLSDDDDAADADFSDDVDGSVDVTIEDLFVFQGLLGSSLASPDEAFL